MTELDGPLMVARLTMDTLKDGWPREGANGCFTHLYGLSDTHVLHMVETNDVCRFCDDAHREGGREEGGGGGRHTQAERREIVPGFADANLMNSDKNHRVPFWSTPGRTDL